MPKRIMSNSQLIEKFQAVHGDTYDYSRVNYTSPKVKVEIICNHHGSFLQIASEHLRPHGCPKCGRERKGRDAGLTNSEFISRAVKANAQQYDYSNTFYRSYSEAVEVMCTKHGAFWVRASDHVKGHGCKECGKIAWYSKAMHNTDRFIKSAREVHGSLYDYSLTDYKGAVNGVKIICQEHGEFTILPSVHVRSKKGCPKCGRVRVRCEEFLARARQSHGANEYDYSLVKYVNSNVKVKIVCKTHGEFMQKPSKHYGGQGCPACCESGGERAVRVALESLGVSFERQWTHKGCRGGKLLPFDFYVPSLRTLIEYDGPQHFGIDWQKFPFDFENIAKNDEIKNQWAKTSGIKLVRIPYTQLKGIPDIIAAMVAGQANGTSPPGQPVP